MSVDDRRYTDHISEQFNSVLKSLLTGLLDMGDLAGLQSRGAIESLMKLDRGKAEQVIQDDRLLNAMERNLDAACADILVRQHPVAGDLRFVIAISKIVTDLERIGDESVKIARRAIELCREGRPPRGNAEVKRIGDAVCNMVDESLRAFAQLSIDKAKKVILADGVVDYEFTDAMRDLVVFMAEDPRCMSRVMKIMSSLRALERIGDHARNIARRAEFLASMQQIPQHPLPQSTVQSPPQQSQEGSAADGTLMML
jgi:phosphate transport system protein